jgi:hypothetical protein
MNLEQGFTDVWQTIDKILHFQLFELNKGPVTVLSLVMFVLVSPYFIFSRK